MASGARELNLIAEDTNQWGMDRCARDSWQQLLLRLPPSSPRPCLVRQRAVSPTGAPCPRGCCWVSRQCRRDGRGLAGLLRELAKLEGLEWLRIL